ncbi:MAG TPA: type 4a pilus biogenesis protein PilO [Pyrinomonadaceae bacterium]|jgi:type IV pilus assembly protein PilO
MSRLESLQQQPWYLQLVLMLVVAGAAYGGFWYMFTSGTRAETKEIQGQLDQLLAANAKAQIAQQRLNEFKAAYARAQADYDDLKALLPEQRELTNVLAGIQDRAKNHLSVQRFTPKDDVQENFYSGKPIEIEVNGNYNNIGAFFAQIAAYQRIVSISDFKLTRIDDKKDDLKRAGQTIGAQFLLTAYYSSPEKLQAARTPATPPPAPAPSGTN